MASKPDKVQRIQTLDDQIDDLRRQVKEDLKSDDDKTRLTALAVALIDRTYARVGNEESAANGVYGVTGWKCEHVSFSGDTATIEYVGKAEVEQSKKLDTKYIVQALQKACEEAEEYILTWDDNGETRKLRAKQVNEYLADYEITAKDIRGFHANDEMTKHLKEQRSSGGALPEDKDEREEKLKEEFKSALDAVSDLLGHEASTLKRDYLVEGLEKSYLEEGEVISDYAKASKTSSMVTNLRMSARIAQRVMSTLQ